MEACSASSSWLPAPTLKKRSSSGQRKRARCRPISDAATERRPRDRARDRAAAALSLALSLSVSLALAVSLSLSVSVSLSLSLCQTLCLAASRWCVRCVRAAAGGTGRAPSPTFADILVLIGGTRTHSYCSSLRRSKYNLFGLQLALDSECVIGRAWATVHSMNPSAGANG